MRDLLTSVGDKSWAKAKDTYRTAMKSSPSEVKFTVAGTAAGLGAGLYVGGAVGIAGFFGAVGIPIAVLGLLGGAIVGNRIGIARDKRQLDELLRKRDKIYRELLAEQDEAKITPISTNREHREIFFRALDEANDTLVILSGWATNYVVDSDFQRRLAACLKRGANVFIGYGYQAAHEPKPTKNYETKAKENLWALCEWSEKQQTKGSLIVREYPNHAKILICDERFAVNGGFNWLSNSGRSQNEERSWVVYDRQFISTELDIVINGLMSPMKATKRDLFRPLTSIFDKRKAPDDDDEPR